MNDRPATPHPVTNTVLVGTTIIQTNRPTNVTPPPTIEENSLLG